MNKDQKQSKGRRIAAMIASAVAVVFITSASALAYFSPFSYVSLDVNPSIEYSVNRFDKVLSVNALNDDGTNILENYDLKYMNIDDAIDETMQIIKDEGQLSLTVESSIVITTYSENEQKSEELKTTLEKSAQDFIDRQDLEVELEVVGVGRERVIEAQRLGVTPGKLNLVQKLQASSENPDIIVVEEWLNRSVQDIMHQIKENKKEAKPKDDSIQKDEDTDLTEEKIKNNNVDSNKNKDKKTEMKGTKPDKPVNKNNNFSNSNANKNKEKHIQNSFERRGPGIK